MLHALPPQTRDRHRPSADLLTVNALRSDGLVVLRLRGELDIATCHLLDHEVEGSVAGAPSDLVVDLSATEFIDSCGLRALLRASQKCTDCGWRLRLIGVGGQVRRLLEQSHTLELFPLVAGRL
jgi:anti-sigma B factor antagonist